MYATNHTHQWQMQQEQHMHSVAMHPDMAVHLQATGGGYPTGSYGGSDAGGQHVRYGNTIDTPRMFNHLEIHRQPMVNVQLGAAPQQQHHALGMTQNYLETPRIFQHLEVHGTASVPLAHNYAQDVEYHVDATGYDASAT